MEAYRPKVSRLVGPIEVAAAEGHEKSNICGTKDSPFFFLNSQVDGILWKMDLWMSFRTNRLIKAHLGRK